MRSEMMLLGVGLAMIVLATVVAFEYQNTQTRNDTEPIQYKAWKEVHPNSQLSYDEFVKLSRTNRLP